MGDRGTTGGRDGKVSFSVSHVNRQFVSGVLTASVDKSALAAAEDGLRAAREQIQLVAEQVRKRPRGELVCACVRCCTTQSPSKPAVCSSNTCNASTRQ